MTDPPRQLDGADVICWIISPVGAFYQLRGGEHLIAAMAVCQYAAGSTYLFKCDAGWNVRQDWDCYDVDDAKESAERDSNGQRIEWRSFNVGSRPLGEPGA